MTPEALKETLDTLTVDAPICSDDRGWLGNERVLIDKRILFDIVGETYLLLDRERKAQSPTFRTNEIKKTDSPLIGIFVGPDYFYKAVLPLGGDIVEARIMARKILTEGFKTTRGEGGIPASELAHCFIATRTEMISKDEANG